MSQPEVNMQVATVSHSTSHATTAESISSCHGECQSVMIGLIFITHTWQPLGKLEPGKAQVTRADNIKAHPQTQAKSICLTKHRTVFSLPECPSDHVNMCLQHVLP